MQSANVNQAIRMIWMELYAVISAEDVPIYVCIYFSENFLFFLVRMAAKAEYLPNSQQEDYIEIMVIGRYEISYWRHQSTSLFVLKKIPSTLINT